MDQPHHDQETATASITFRCSPSLKNAIIEAAKRDRRKPSQWIVVELQKLMESREKGLNSLPNPRGKTEAVAS